MFKTSTPEGTEGNNISYSTEKRCAEKILKHLPKDWNVKFDWCQILMSDVQYQIDQEKKLIEIQYNQNLNYWFAPMFNEILAKVK